MIKYLLAFTGFAVLFASCNSEPESDRSNEKGYIRVAVQRRVAKKVEKKHRLRASGFGFWGPDCYEELKIFFVSPVVLSRDEARFLILDVAADFLEVVNQDENIRPHLCQHPYTMNHLSIAFFPKRNGYEKPIYPDYVVIDFQGGIISYKTKLENQKYGYHSEEDETFEEALKILREQGRAPEYFKDY